MIIQNLRLNHWIAVKMKLGGRFKTNDKLHDT